jgi:hypothetical protein
VNTVGHLFNREHQRRKAAETQMARLREERDVWKTRADALAEFIRRYNLVTPLEPRGRRLPRQVEDEPNPGNDERQHDQQAGH